MEEGSAEEVVTDDSDVADKERRHILIYHLISRSTGLLKTIVRVLGTVGVFWILKEMLVPFAGQESIADLDFLIQLAADLNVSEWAAYALGISGASYGYYQRRQRDQDVERLSSRIETLEKIVDPDRSSSNLRPTGRRRPED